MSRTWFITGTSRGFGREWAIAALDRGDRVAATARDAASLDDLVQKYGDALLPIALDVTDRAADFAAVAQAHEHFGSLDIVVNNAGYGHFGMIEEITEDEARRQVETNLFGALWVTQAALPLLREQGSGHLIQVSSIGGVSAFPRVGIYHASKWALEGFSQALAQEVAGFGIHVTLVEPGAFSTDWSGSSSSTSQQLPAYDEVHRVTLETRARRASNPGDPEATREAILRVVDADEPPLRVFFGAGPLGIATADYESRLKTWNDWQDVALIAQGGNGNAEMDLDQALAAARANHQSVLTTLRRDGKPQLSNVLHAVGDDDVIRVSTTADRAKYHNLRREPWAALKVDGESFWSYAVLEADVSFSEVAAAPDDAAVEELVEYFRAVGGEHSDWDDYRRAMVAEQRLVLRLAPTRAYGALR